MMFFEMGVAAHLLRVYCAKSARAQKNYLFHSTSVIMERPKRNRGPPKRLQVEPNSLRIKKLKDASSFRQESSTASEEHTSEDDATSSETSDDVSSMVRRKKSRTGGGTIEPSDEGNEVSDSVFIFIDLVFCEPL